MKIYVRKIDNQCVEKQISILKGIVSEFFHDNLSFKGINSVSKIEHDIKILPATDPRFSSADIKEVINDNLEIGDLLVFYEIGDKKYEIELIKPSSSEYDSLMNLCSRDERHSVLYVEGSWKDNEPIFAEDLTEEQLGIELKELYDSNVSDKVTNIYLFGIKYGRLIVEKNYNKRNIISLSGINDSYYAELNKAINISAFAKILNKSPKLVIKNGDNNNKVKNAYNMIYYGTPGCGKSYLVNKKFNDNEYFIFRTTFHPEYSNSDFVGQIVPKTEENQIKYEFQEGPFSIALLNAILNPTQKVCLIIEEINRGNASAIFGDIFQLLDRDNEGNSIYSIVNEPIKNYLKSNGVNVEKITIPSNLWIIATMNTSDQNVFTLDTAFKRRWRMHRIVNKFDLEAEYDKKLASMYIPGSTYTWEQFITTINDEIIRKNPTGLNSEDKQLGVYFVTNEELSFIPADSNQDNIDKFVEKVLLYIWDDVAKIDPALWFGENIKSFDDLIKEYNEKKLEVFRDIFKEQMEALQLREENE